MSNIRWKVSHVKHLILHLQNPMFFKFWFGGVAAAWLPPPSLACPCKGNSQRIIEFNCKVTCNTSINLKLIGTFICLYVSDRFSLRDAPFGSCNLRNFNINSWWLPLEEWLHVTNKCSKVGYCSKYVLVAPADILNAERWILHNK